MKTFIYFFYLSQFHTTLWLILISQRNISGKHLVRIDNHIRAYYYLDVDPLVDALHELVRHLALPRLVAVPGLEALKASTVGPRQKLR